MNRKHTLFHYLFTIIITILKDGLLIGLSVALILAGLYFFKKEESFYRIAVAGPILIAGVALLFMRLADVIEIILNPRINKSRCLLCPENKNIDK